MINMLTSYFFFLIRFDEEVNYEDNAGKMNNKKSCSQEKKTIIRNH